MDGKKDITIKDIAREAGVSIGTISNFLHKREIVSDRLAEKIEKAISKYDYRTNVAASSLRRNKTRLIGIIIPDSSNLVFSYIIREIEKHAHQEGYSVVVCNSNYDVKTEIEHINILKSRNIDGLILMPTKEDKNIFKYLDLKRTPAVIIYRQINGLEIDYVMADTNKAMIDVVDYLYGLGHKKIAYIDRETELVHSRRRLEGYKKGLEKNGLGFDRSLYFKGRGFMMEDGYRDMKKIFKLEKKPTAMVVFNDNLAIGVMKAISDRGLRVPDDFSVIGYDNSYIDAYLQPSLTSVTLERKKIALNSFKILLERMKGNWGKLENPLISASLVIRKSTGKAKVDL